MGLLVEIPSISRWNAVISGRGVGAGLALRSGRRALTGDGWFPRSPARGLAARPPCGTLRLSLPQREFRARCAQTHLAATVPCDEPGWEQHPPRSSAPPGLGMEEERLGEPPARPGTCHRSASCGLTPGCGTAAPTRSQAGAEEKPPAISLLFIFFLAYSTCSTRVVWRCPAPRALGWPRC